MRARILQVSTTVASEDDAARIAEHLVEARLAACAHIEGPLESIYTWKGKLCREVEWKCTLKTSAELLPELERELLSLHPYETPEFVVTEFERASEDYGEWLLDVLEGRD